MNVRRWLPARVCAPSTLLRPLGVLLAVGLLYEAAFLWQLGLGSASRLASRSQAASTSGLRSLTSHLENQTSAANASMARQSVSEIRSSFTVQPTVAITTGGEKIRICTQLERITHVRRVCEKWRQNMHAQLLFPAKRSIADDVHRLLYCFMSKVGCTAIKTLLVRANARATHREDLLPRRTMNIHNWGLLKKVQLIQLAAMTSERMDKILATYFKFMIMRHPFDRLISAWRDKIVHSEQSEFRKWPGEILRRYRPEAFALTPHLKMNPHPERVLGPPKFDEFLQWIVDKQINNEHWLSAVESCHVCANDWDAILRIETMASDERIILDKLDGSFRNSSLPVTHSFGDGGRVVTTSHHLPEFRNISGDVVDYFLKKYDVDMELFGYHWNRTTTTTVCSIETDNGPCC